MSRRRSPWSRAAALLLLAAAPSSAQDLTRWVDPRIGSRTSFALSHGNTFPAAARPGGMTAWSPQTAGYGNSLFYDYDADSLNGLRATHQASVWMSDYGDVSFMAVTGEPGFLPHQRASPFSHDHERARPQSYSVDLPRYGLRLEVAPSSRAAVLRVVSARSDTVTLIVDPHPPGTLVEVHPDQALLMALTATRLSGAPDGFRAYVMARFDRQPVAWGTWSDSTDSPGSTRAGGEHAGAWVRFTGVRRRPLEVRVGTSFISAAQAAINLQRELAGGYEETERAGGDAWNDLLGRARVDGGTEERRVVYYTALYRSFLFPREWHEIEADGDTVHYSPYDGRLHPGVMVADLGLWDAYRTHLPLLALLDPERMAVTLRGLANVLREGGRFPKWMSPGYREGMPGTQAEIVFADAEAKGIPIPEAEAVYAGLRRDATEPGDRTVGRLGLEYYQSLGYVPADRVEGSVSRTLEFAYSDFALGRLAGALGKGGDARLFAERSRNWRHVFDARSGFVRGRRADGSWEPLDPLAWGGPFVEGNAWHYTWAPVHDADGLVAALGGPAALADRLDSLLAAPSTIRQGAYDHVIHEMRELAASGTGQYAQGNQVSHHVLYLYDLSATPWQTAPRVRDVADRLYRATPDGYPGDEDTGSLGSWYVFSALGTYPLQPGVPRYALGAPRFPRAELTLPAGGRLLIEAVGVDDDQAVYVQEVTLDGVRLSAPFVDHARLLRGGTLRFHMSREPNPDLFLGAGADSTQVRAW